MDRAVISESESRDTALRRPRASLSSGPPALQWQLFFVFLALVSPVVINYSGYSLTWDESYYLGRIICINQAVYDFRLSHLNDCFVHTHKGPIMGLVNLLWGRAGGTERGIGLAFVGLAIFIWILIVATYRTCLQSGISQISLLLAACTICLTPFLRSSGGAMMTDILLGWCIALALMLIPLEYCRPSKDFWPSVMRGLLWSLVIDVGILSKVTFLFFVCVISIALLIIRERYSGEYPLRYAFFSCIVGCMPALIIWRYYGLNFLRFALMVAWGDTAKLWSVPGMTPFGYLKRYFIQLGFALIPLTVLLLRFIHGVVVQNERRLARLLPLCIILAYLGIAARSQNRDPRFAIPIMIVMPLCLAWASVKEQPRVRLGSVPIIAALLLGTVFSVPMIHRPQLAPIQRAGALLSSLRGEQPMQRGLTKVVIATDGPAFNIDTFLLARQLDLHNLEGVDLDTLVYDAINKRTLEDGLRRIDAADYVLFLKDNLEPGANWARVHAAEYRAYCEKVGVLLDSRISPDLVVFKIGKTHAP